MPLIDAVRISSKNLAFLTALDQGKLRNYITDDTLNPLFRNAIKMCQNDEILNEYFNMLPDLTKKTKFSLDLIIKKDIITKKDWKQAYFLFDQAIKYYAKIDFDFYSLNDLKKYNVKTRNNFNKLLIFKNKARKRLVNKILTGHDCYFDLFIQKIAKQYNLSEADINFYTIKDIFNLLEGRKVKSQIIRARKDTCIICSYNAKMHYIWGVSARRMINFLEKNQNTDNQIKGLVASRKNKNIIGFVRIIKLDFKKIKSLAAISKKIKQNDILVADTTTPEMLPIMKKVSAIITDFGGLNTHAAIISRELKKPCIIGTKIATQVLHDGDLVEVDADKGVVKILKKNEK